MAFISEADVEAVFLATLNRLGYATASDNRIGPDGLAPEREAYADVFLQKRLETAVEALNPHIPLEARQDAIRALTATVFPNLTEENRRIHRMMVEGVDVEFPRDDGSIAGDKVRLIDFDTPEDNDWLAVNQFTVIGGKVACGLTEHASFIFVILFFLKNGFL